MRSSSILAAILRGKRRNKQTFVCAAYNKVQKLMQPKTRLSKHHLIPPVPAEAPAEESH